MLVRRFLAKVVSNLKSSDSFGYDLDTIILIIDHKANALFLSLSLRNVVAPILL